MVNFDIKLEIYKAIEKWTVYKLIESHFDIDLLEALKLAIYEHLVTLRGRKATDNSMLIYNLSNYIYEALEDINVECDRYSCNGISSILVAVYSDLEEGKVDLITKIEKIKGVHVVQNLSSEEYDD